MRYFSIISAVAAVALFMMGPTITNAQNTTTANQNRNTSQHNNRANNANNMQGKTVRASEVIGMTVYNHNGEDLAEINDVVLDPNTGKVRYAAVTYGGILGIGDEMFAVPWEAFQCERDPENPDEHRITLDVNRKQLEGAEGFDQENWPNFADRNFTENLDRRYHVNRNRDRNSGSNNRQIRNDLNNNRNRNVDVDVNREGVNVDVDRDRKNREQ